MLKLLDVGWVARKAADNMSQTLTIDQSYPDLKITYKTMMGSTTDLLKFGEEITILTGAEKRKQKVLVRSEDDAIVTRTKVSLNRGILEHRYRLNPDRSGLFLEMTMSHRNGKSAKCITHNLWDELELHINDFFNKKNLGDLIKGRNENTI